MLACVKFNPVKKDEDRWCMQTGKSTFQEDDLRILKLAVGVYALIFTFKLAVYFVTGVMALFAEERCIH